MERNDLDSVLKEGASAYVILFFQSSPDSWSGRLLKTNFEENLRFSTDLKIGKHCPNGLFFS